MTVLLIVGALGRVGRTPVRLAGGLVLAGIIQALLGVISESAPAIGVLHGMTALAIFSLSELLAHRTRTAARADPAAS